MSSFNTKTSVVLLLLFLFGWGQNSHAQTIQIGSGTGTSSYIPFYYYYEKGYTQTIYSHNELTGSGMDPTQGYITTIRYMAKSTRSTSYWEDWTIYLGNTTQDGFSNGNDWVGVANMTQVFDGKIPSNVVANQWMEITLDTPFQWDGTSNIVVGINQTTPVYGNDPSWAGYTSYPPSGSKGIYVYRDGSSYDPVSPPYGSTTNSVAQIQFDGNLMAPCTSAPTAGAITGPSTVCANEDVNLVGTAIGSVSGIEYQWQESNDGTTWVDILGANSYNHTVAGGVSADTYYRLGVSCANSSGTDYSNSVFVQLTTYTAPWLYDVETAMNTTNSNISDKCWSSSPNNTTSYFRWDVKGNGGQTGSLNTGPSTGYGGGPAYFYTEASSGSLDDSAYLYSPAVDISGLSNPALYFQYHKYGSTMGDLLVQVSSDGGASWTTELNIIGQQQTSYSDAWKEGLVNLNPYSGGLVFVRFIGTRGSNYYGDMAIDDISFQEGPACWNPINLQATNITGNFANLGWTEIGTATNWNVEYGLAGFVQGNGTLNSTTSNPYPASNLIPETDYQFYVQADCGGGDESDWIGPYSFTTPCASFMAPWSEDFENYGSIPDCWTQGVNNQKDWRFSNTGSGSYIGSGGTINGTTTSGGYFAWVDDSSPNAHDTYLISPLIDVSNLTNPMLRFYLLSDSQSADNVDFSVDVYDGASWNIGVFTSNSNTHNEAWEQIEVYFGTLTITGDIRIRFVVDENNGSDFYDDVAIDDVEILEAPPCPLPNFLTDSNVTYNSIDLAWVENGSATTWNIEYGPTGFTPGTGTMLTGVTNNPETITGLSTNTEYDFYVQADCGGGEVSPWSNVYGPVRTECYFYMANGFCESFDLNLSPSLDCWKVLDENSDGSYWQVSTENPNTGSYSAVIDTDYNGGDNNDYLVSPSLSMSGIEFMKFSYAVNSSSEPNDFQVLLSTTGTNPADFTDTIMHLGQYSNTNYQDTMIDLTMFTGNVYIAFHVPPGGLDGWKLFIDDVCFAECVPTPGQDGSIDVCSLDGYVDLTDNVISTINYAGTWNYLPSQNVIVEDTLFDAGSVAEKSHELLYIVEGFCATDTTIATINVHGPSLAGNDGSLSVCMNEPTNLFYALSGTVDAGGDWYDYSNTLLPNSQPNANGNPGDYQYYYVTSNGYCPADTAFVTLTVKETCNYLAIDKEMFSDLSVYPNPATSQLNIKNGSKNAAVSIELLDMKGRVVLVESRTFENNTEVSIDIEHLENGVYTLRIHDKQNQKIFKIVKQ